VTAVLAVHGGAGVRAEAADDPALRAAIHAGLATALRAGHAVLQAGGAALDAVVAAVCALEDNPLFNAGRGAVLTSDGKPEMDAAVMRGVDRAAGAVASICGPRNPIRVARTLVDATPVMLVAEGALRFARAAGLPFEPESYFVTESRKAALAREMERRKKGLPDDRDDYSKHGTVGSVARDASGGLAAATSTGGLTGKMPGRVGDTPVFGSGTWADDTVAVSCTGDGEVFIRHAAAHELSARLRYAGAELADAAEAMAVELAKARGSGGLIAVGRDGNPVLPFNSAGMYRGIIGTDGVPWVAIHREALASVQ
jgi:L-asparaginase / beta-aspartyl-peptidase